MNITIDDNSPQFQYYSKSNGWIQDHRADNWTVDYFKQTFMGTYTQGDYVSLTFNGTAIAVYGARRSNHGYYATKLDDGAMTFQNANSGPPKFQTVIFQAAGLSPNIEHTLTMTNTPDKNNLPVKAGEQWWFDVDYAVITTAPVVGEVYTTVIDDGSSAISYRGTGWAEGNPDKNYYNTSLHVSSKPTDLMQLQFNGSSIQLFGGTYVDYGNYSISIDNAPEQVFNGTYFQLQAQTPLYTASNLTDGPHTLTMVNLGAGPAGSFLDFDYAVVNSTIDPSGTHHNATGTNTTSSASGNDKSGGSSSNTGAIAGGVVGGVVGLALVAILAWFLFRRKNRNREGYPYPSKSKEPMDLNGEEVKPFEHGNSNQYMQALPSTVGSSGTGSIQTSPHSYPNNGNNDSLTSPSTAAREMDQSNTPFLTAIPPPPSSNATSYPRSVNPPSSIGRSGTINEGDRYYQPMSNPFSNVAGSTATFGNQPQSSTGSGSSREENNTTSSGSRTTKTPGVSLPFTALPPIPSSHLSEDIHRQPSTSPIEDINPPRAPFANSSSNNEREGSIRSNRIYVPGREQDMGPLGIGHEEDQDVYETLPPDYQQATEPLPGQRREPSNP
ncbi:uncharacterized protein L201_006637 [Kwoniella dendrophila CBS 6074]|uniref:Uncharacterized protein n=1 Tax=Kwoniella dendrophila CBS 6074 TaxID=1295534 RepID=A0AAX4K1W3_9TREE